MATYKAKKRLFVGNRMIEPRERFDSDETPGKEWEPVDRSAEVAVEAKRRKDALDTAQKLAGAIPVAEAGSGKPIFNKQDIEIPTATADDIEAAKKWRASEAAREEREAKEYAAARAEEDKVAAKRKADEQVARAKAEQAAAAERKGTR